MGALMRTIRTLHLGLDVCTSPPPTVILVLPEASAEALAESRHPAPRRAPPPDCTLRLGAPLVDHFVAGRADVLPIGLSQADERALGP